jgi:allantoinase
MPLSQLTRLTAANPARQFGLYPRKGALRPGSDADLAIVDLEGSWTVHPDDLFQKNRHSPYEGLTLHGAVERTLVRGVTICDRGTFPAPAGHGQLLRR